MIGAPVAAARSMIVWIFLANTSPSEHRRSGSRGRRQRPCDRPPFPNRSRPRRCPGGCVRDRTPTNGDAQASRSPQTSRRRAARRDAAARSSSRAHAVDAPPGVPPLLPVPCVPVARHLRRTVTSFGERGLRWARPRRLRHPRRSPRRCVVVPLNFQLVGRSLLDIGSKPLLRSGIAGQKGNGSTRLSNRVESQRNNVVSHRQGVRETQREGSYDRSGKNWSGEEPTVNSLAEQFAILAVNLIGERGSRQTPCLVARCCHAEP